MSLPRLIPPLGTFEDPGRLGQLLSRATEEHARYADQLLHGQWKSEGDAREMIGFCRCIRWIISVADELMRPISDPEPEDESRF